MTPGAPTRIIAACCGLAGFAIAIVGGLAADNPAEEVLVRGLISLFLCNVLGWIIGAVAERTVRESISGSGAARDINNLSTDRAAVPSPERPLSAAS